MKNLFIAVLILSMAFAANAQRFGARLGGNFAGMMSTVESKGTEIAPGLNIGLLAEFGPEMLGIHAEINYAQKGFNVDLNEDMGGATMNTVQQINFNYLEVPVLIKANLPSLLYVYAGPYFGFALNGNVATEATVDGEEQDLGENADVDLFGDNSIYKKSDFGIATGLGAQFGLGPLAAFVEGRATLGLSNLYDTESEAYKAFVEAGAYKDSDHLKNMVFTVGVGIIFGD